MANRWCILTTRMGADIREPADADLRQALDDVLASDDAERPNAWLQLGEDEGPMFTLDVYASGKIVFEQWADADFNEELAPQVVVAGASATRTLELWQALRRGEVDAVRRMVRDENAPG